MKNIITEIVKDAVSGFLETAAPSKFAPLCKWTLSPIFTIVAESMPSLTNFSL